MAQITALRCARGSGMVEGTNQHSMVDVAPLLALNQNFMTSCSLGPFWLPANRPALWRSIVMSQPP